MCVCPAGNCSIVVAAQDVHVTVVTEIVMPKMMTLVMIVSGSVRVCAWVWQATSVLCSLLKAIPVTEAPASPASTSDFSLVSTPRQPQPAEPSPLPSNSMYCSYSHSSQCLSVSPCLLLIHAEKHESLTQSLLT